MALGFKRRAIEKKHGCLLQALLKGRLLANATQEEVAKEFGLDPATVRYYIKKWDLPYDKKAARRGTRSKGDHLKVCICIICKHSRLCRGSRESHHRGRCVMWCLEFLDEHQKERQKK